jgi:hypothetical protein
LRVAEAIGDVINRVLRPAGVMLARAAPSQAESWRERIGGPYRSDREVIRLAAARGLSVGDYLEAEWGQPGRSKRIIRRIRESGAIPDDLQTVCEIGPGSGRYIQRILEIAAPVRYEICELEARRARWLARTYPVVVLPADGESLSSTSDRSVQLVHAHGVFASLKVISCLAYFTEMARVVAPGGHVVFDAISDKCMTDVDVAAWLQTPLRYVNLLTRPFLVRFFADHGLTLIDDFCDELMVFGRSHYFVFRRNSACASSSGAAAGSTT